MKHYELPTIRRLILSGQMDSEEIVEWSDKITRFSMSMYAHEKLDITNQEYFDALHWGRFDNRIEELASKSEWFNQTLSKEDISINGKAYKNLPVLYKRIRAKQDWFNPEFVGRWSTVIFTSPTF